mmetsp:Transcript_25328/g.55289  ORF Transcript_25328/g.55289 Transcript_25328/m.55289 type:complete len:502 (+) Transcript_25328:57-1562(+)
MSDMSFKPGCVVCHSEEAFLFEIFSGTFHSACRHAACQSCLENWVVSCLPHCRSVWQLRVPCLFEGCSRYIPQALVRLSSHARVLADAIDTGNTWPSLPNVDMVCPRCQKVKDQVYVNKSCGDGACEECWLSDLEPKLKWCEANYTLDVPCGYRGCPEGCSDVLMRFESSLLPQVTHYVEKVKAELAGFSTRWVHDAPPCAPGPVCPVCQCMTYALLYCLCGHAACKQCWEASVEAQLHWCKENFAFAPEEPWHGNCTCAWTLHFVGPELLSPIHLYAQELQNQLRLVQQCSIPRGNKGPKCPICSEVSLALLCGAEDVAEGHSSHAAHAACERCWARWAEEQLQECFLYKRAPARCLWPACCADMASDASDSLWQLSQRSSSKLKGLMDGLRRRKRLQNNPLYSAEFQVECPQCVGLGYIGFDTVMCFLCEYQWEDTGQPPEICLALEGDELQLCPGLRVRKCPKCREYIEKNGGCDHMTCRCRHQFSWTTLKPWGVVTQ